MQETEHSRRLLSLDAYRGFVMLAMVSAGFGFSAVLAKHPVESVAVFDGTLLDGFWRWAWPRLVNQFSHVAWQGCTFWDLIQPSFFFLVGASMPFSYRKRMGLSVAPASLHWKAARRAVILVLLGILLASQGDRQDGLKFLFTNVLAQIGLGYFALHLLMPYGYRVHLMVLVTLVVLGSLILMGYSPGDEQTALVTGHLQEMGKGPSEWSQFSGWHASFNKHLNAFAGFDRWFLNLFPGPEQPGPDNWFVVNPGGYHTMNFFPSLINMVIGLMAGKTLMTPSTYHSTVLKRLFGAGVLLIVFVLAVDTTIWPEWVPHLELFRWSVCPSIKRIWTPTFALFSAGWTLIMMGAFFTVIEVWGLRKWSFPLAVVGMNSIAIYLMYQLARGWIAVMWEKALTTFDAVFHTSLTPFIFDDSAFVFADVLQSLLVIGSLWFMCWFMYRKRIFFRI